MIGPPLRRCACLTCSLYCSSTPLCLRNGAPSGPRLVLTALSCASPRHLVRNAGSLLVFDGPTSQGLPVAPSGLARGGAATQDSAWRLHPGLHSCRRFAAAIVCDFKGYSLISNRFEKGISGVATDSRDLPAVEKAIRRAKIGRQSPLFPRTHFYHSLLRFGLGFRRLRQRR